MDTFDSKIIQAVELILQAIGEDRKRPGLRDTPERVVRAWKEWTRGYQKFPREIKTFPTDYDGLIIRKGIPFFSFCEHHLAPYTGLLDFGYIPKGKVVGISKIIRFFRHYCARLSIQEDLTKDIIGKFEKIVEPKGSIIRMSANHTCESTRGVTQNGVPTITFYSTGIFKKDPALVTEFFNNLNT
ncbi:MAG: GTP cyclohydrolase I [Candidatus Niyogibacteria bacterium]|nr:GTP cyclohydrolase I [Candidatus Niyogibacteria bacterium]